MEMNDVFIAESTTSEENRRPLLRFAVGAMITPERTRDFYDELLRRIANLAGYRATLMQRRTYAEVNSLLAAGKVDIAYVCSGAYVLGNDEFGMEILAVPVVNGKPVYYSYILTHRDSAIKSFNDLKGHRFAFTDPDSNTGYLVPSYMVTQRGETPESFFRETFFTYSHDDSIRAVADGLADGAAVDSLIWDYFKTIDPLLTSRTRIISKSPPYGIPPFVVHPELDRTLKERLRNIVFALHKDEKAAPLLRQLQIDRFVAGEDSMYATVREMRRWVRKKPDDRP